MDNLTPLESEIIFFLQSMTVQIICNQTTSSMHIGNFIIFLKSVHVSIIRHYTWYCTVQEYTSIATQSVVCSHWTRSLIFGLR